MIPFTALLDATRADLAIFTIYQTNKRAPAPGERNLPGWREGTTASTNPEFSNKPIAVCCQRCPLEYSLDSLNPFGNTVQNGPLEAVRKGNANKGRFRRSTARSQALDRYFVRLRYSYVFAIRTSSLFLDPRTGQRFISECAELNII